MNKIKKLLAASLVVLCLCGCGDKKAESEVSPQTSASEASGASEALSESSRIENEGTDLKEVFSKISESVELPSMNEFNDKLLQRYYGIDPLTVADYAGGIDNSGVGQDEILLVKVSDESQVESVRESFQTRYDQKLREQENYNAEEAEKIRKCEVRVQGLYVTLIISDDAVRINEIVNEYIG